MRFIADRYKVIKKIPGGNMSTIYHCLDRKLDSEEVILKVFDKTGTENEDFQSKLFYREVENLEILNHQNIIQIINKGIDNENEKYYITLEFIEGKNLNYFIKGWDLPVNEKLKIIVQILDAVIYAHSKNVIHRDLKPGNILIDTEYNVKIIDFGISKFESSIFSDYTFKSFGTPKYASSEQKKSLDITFKTDIYALGIIFYEFLENKILEIDSIANIKELIEKATLEKSIKDILVKMVDENENSSLTDVRKVFIQALKGYQKHEGKYYVLGFTNNAVKKLFNFGYIAKEDRELAFNFIDKDLSKEIYINLNTQQSEQEKFNLFGEVGEYKCVVDQLTHKTLTVVDIWFQRHDVMSHNKERAMLIDEPIEVSLWTDNGTVEYDVNELLQKVKNYSYEQKRIYSQEKNEKISFEKWGKALDLYRKEIEEQKQTLMYKRFEIMKDGLFIKVYTKNKLEANPFDENSPICMTKKNKHTTEITVGFCIDSDEDGVVIQVNKDINIDDIATSGEISIQKNHLLVSLERQKRALKAVQYREMKNNAVGEIFLNPNKAVSLDDVEIKRYVQNLDENKKQAVYKALNSKDIFLLQGPPGTGKTTFITELVSQIIMKNSSSRILITSQSHVAVDHALSKITESEPGIKVLRVGREEKLSLGTEQYMLDNQLMNWIEEIKIRCIQYMMKLKESLDLNPDITLKYNLIQDLESIDNNLEKLQKELLELKKEELVLLEKYKLLQKIVSEANSMSNKIKEQFKLNKHNSLLEIAENFEKEFSKLGQHFISEFENVSLVSEKKQNIELNILEKELLELEQKERKTDLYNLLEVSNIEELNLLKQNTISQFNQNQEEYKKIRKLEKIHEEWIQRLAPTGSMGAELIRDVNIIGATCLGIANLPATANITFDWVIIDEAARATVPEILVPIIQGKKIVLVGDHKQLPPMIDKALYENNNENIKVKELQKTLFEELIESVDESCMGILSEQYRMHPSIGNLISEVFYNGVLKSSKTTENRTHYIQRWSGKGVVWISTANYSNRNEQVIFTPHLTYQNDLECEQIISILKELNIVYKEKNVTKVIGVITGYQAQRNLLKKKIESKQQKEFSNIILDINTVDAFQGRETDIIIYSVVRSNKDKQIGFLADERRLNVALSRARDLLIIVGDDETVQYSSIVNNPFKDILRYIKNHPEQCTIEEWEK